jgi:GNAT superfamily N-acetyltransferase
MNGIQLKLYEHQNKPEAQELEEIFKEYFPNSPWPPNQMQIIKSSAVYFRAFYEGEQVGLSGYLLKTPTLAETIKTTIFKPHRGKKLGALLSQAIEDECRRIGVKKVISTVYFFNHQMVHIKLKQGYTIEGYHPDHEAPGFHEYSLGKILK